MLAFLSGCLALLVEDRAWLLLGVPHRTTQALRRFLQMRQQTALLVCPSSQPGSLMVLIELLMILIEILMIFMEILMILIEALYVFDRNLYQLT